MKKVIFFLIIVGFVSQTHAATGSISTVLKPSLTLQMNKNTVILKENLKNQKLTAIQQRIAANKARLASLRTPSTKITTASVTGTVSQSPQIASAKITLTPQTNTTPTQQKIYTSAYDGNVKNVDMNAVRNTWLSWTNSARSDLWLVSYTLDERLNVTATEWSWFSRDRGYIIHGRPGDGCVWAGNYSCYNFTAIDTWFKARGIDPVVINRSKHTENIGYGRYSCSSSDCTSALISSIRSTFDFFMSEKGKSYDVHYRSIIQPNFSKIGVGVVIDESKSTYYLTVHYITK